MLNISSMIGIPFKDQGRDLKGCDCWGLALLVFREFGIELPDYKVACDEMSSINGIIDSRRVAWEPCDRANLPTPALVVIRFNSITFCNHIGTYIGENSFIHTARKLNSHITSIDSPAWNRRIEGFYVPKKEE